MQESTVALFLGIAVVLGSCSGERGESSRPFHVTTRALYRASFTTPYKHITVKASGGMSWQGHDAWMLFVTDRAVSLRMEHLYREMPPESCLDEFHATVGIDDALLRDDGELRCLLFTDSTKTYANGRSLLFNTREGVYYFHSWSHR